MAYLLKYYKELVSHGHRWRLEIHQDTDDAIEAVEIGPVLQGLRLIMQGDQADIDTPIVKTSLEMVFVDAPNLEDKRKCGYWEEFYTSTATEYRVRLMKDGTVEWTGYVTPDSFSESLQYRGSVSIIARDNLGHLQDFAFDMAGDENGMVTLWDIVNTALAKVSFAMAEWDDTDLQHLWPSSEDAKMPSLQRCLFNVAAFKDQNWWEVLEGVLYSIGVTFRYVGGNTFVLTPIRNLGMGTRTMWADVPTREARFLSYGHRELSPAAKAIKEVADFDIVDEIADTSMPADAYGDESTYDFDMYPDSPWTEMYKMPVHATVAGGWDRNSASNSLMLNVFQYADKKEYRFGEYGEVKDPSVVYLAANQYNATRQASFKLRLLKAGTFKLSFAFDKIISLYDNNTAVGYCDSNVFLDYVQILAQFIGDDGSTLSLVYTSDYKGTEWVDTDMVPITESDTRTRFETGELTTEGPGEVVLYIYRPVVRFAAPIGEGKGAYIGIKDAQVIVMNNASKPIMRTLRINTDYNDKNNVVLTRSPLYAANPSNVVSPKVVRNGIFVEDTNQTFPGSERWYWNEGDTPQPLAVLIHQQMLAYYSRPMNVLTGELVDIEQDDPLFTAFYIWNGKPHILMSGTLNVLTGRMENAVLREFQRYDKMWETHITPEDVTIDSAAAYITIEVKSAKTFTINMLGPLPSWLTLDVYSGSGDNGIIQLRAMQNSSGEERTAYIKIDTAYCRIKQRA
jgi:hypothetical protein